MSAAKRVHVRDRHPSQGLSGGALARVVAKPQRPLKSDIASDFVGETRLTRCQKVSSFEGLQISKHNGKTRRARLGLEPPGLQGKVSVVRILFGRVLGRRANILKPASSSTKQTVSECVPSRSFAGLLACRRRTCNKRRQLLSRHIRTKM